MDMQMTPPSGVTLSQTSTPLIKAVTEMVTQGLDTEEGDVAALVGGVICAVLLLLISIMAVLLWLMSRQKGSYDTNEMDDEAEGADEELDGSDPALQMKEPLTIREEE
ncbi:small cell adhesion glycoprotein homolog [Takifugu flavidus]|uniref:small cell adhesion glycoprotein homolog n=1 Tax=Takifugu flavidus TaxID=433684 RepID=UPI002544BF5C|nr:small cell adhesion glycoprotein homolog [Takifugu flavidus]XP_056883735.1 small cell adhesion glycoprotein homolog [Takifugu flavidus]